MDNHRNEHKAFKEDGLLALVPKRKHYGYDAEDAIVINKKFKTNAKL